MFWENTIRDKYSCGVSKYVCLEHSDRAKQLQKALKFSLSDFQVRTDPRAAQCIYLLHRWERNRDWCGRVHLCAAVGVADCHHIGEMVFPKTWPCQIKKEENTAGRLNTVRLIHKHTRRNNRRKRKFLRGFEHNNPKFAFYCCAYRYLPLNPKELGIGNIFCCCIL